MTKHNEEKKKVIDLSASITLQCAYNLLIRFLLFEIRVVKLFLDLYKQMRERKKIHIHQSRQLSFIFVLEKKEEEEDTLMFKVQKLLYFTR
jgi:hypothetical protein